MKRHALIFVFLSLFVCATAGCAGAPAADSSAAGSSRAVSDGAAPASSAPEEDALPDNKAPISNLEFRNSGMKPEECDGIEYIIFSKAGYNKASMNFALSKAELQMTRKSDRKFANAYVFLGMDVLRNKSWSNGVDAGMGYSQGKWFLCVNVSQTLDDSTWWQSPKEIDPTHDYRMELDASQEDDRATLSVYDQTDGEKLVDTHSFSFLGSKKDGNNLSVYRAASIAWPTDVQNGPDGEPVFDDWEAVTQYNTDEGMYFKNIQLSDCTLSDASGAHVWTAERTKDRFLYPSSLEKKIDYPCVTIDSETKDAELTMDLNLNR